MLGVGKHESVDGTFKLMTKKWKDLFVFMIEWQDAFHPVAFGWSPDESYGSYYVFLFMVPKKFRQLYDTIANNQGRSKLKVKKIKLDFEVEIYKAFASN